MSEMDKKIKEGVEEYKTSGQCILGLLQAGYSTRNTMLEEFHRLGSRPCTEDEETKRSLLKWGLNVLEHGPARDLHEKFSHFSHPIAAEKRIKELDRRGEIPEVAKAASELAKAGLENFKNENGEPLTWKDLQRYREAKESVPLEKTPAFGLMRNIRQENEWLDKAKIENGEDAEMIVYRLTDTGHSDAEHDTVYYQNMARGLLKDHFIKPDGVDDRTFQSQMDKLYCVTTNPSTKTPSLWIICPEDQTNLGCDLQEHGFLPHYNRYMYHKVAPKSNPTAPAAALSVKADSAGATYSA